jgi:hypothetical protein
MKTNKYVLGCSICHPVIRLTLVVQHAHAYGGKVSKSNGIYNYTSNNLNRSNSFQIFPNTISTNTSAEISNQTNIFGIHKLYPTAGNGEEWYMNMSDPS